MNVIQLGLPVIKKHFSKLCSSLPSNYKKTVKRLQQLNDLAEEDMMLILSSNDDQLTDPVAVNQRILIYLFMNCQSCDQLLDVHRILEDLINPMDHLNIHNFQRGMYIVMTGFAKRGFICSIQYILRMIRAACCISP